MESIPSSDICRKCAECCKDYCYVEVSQVEIEALEKFTGLRFDVFTDPKGNAVDEYFLKVKENGDCCFLNVNNGIYSCAVYEARGAICRNFPSDPSQHKFCDANKKKHLNNNSG